MDSQRLQTVWETTSRRGGWQEDGSDPNAFDGGDGMGKLIQAANAQQQIAIYERPDGSLVGVGMLEDRGLWAAVLSPSTLGEGGRLWKHWRD